MFELRQHGSIIEYVSQFQDLLSQAELPIADLDKHFYFQNGLRHETSTKVNEESPTTFDETIQTASNFEFAHFTGKTHRPFQTKNDATPSRGTASTSTQPKRSKAWPDKRSFSSKNEHKDSWKKEATCHKCKRKGHISPDCPSKEASHCL